MILELLCVSSGCVFFFSFTMSVPALEFLCSIETREEHRERASRQDLAEAGKVCLCEYAQIPVHHFLGPRSCRDITKTVRKDVFISSSYPLMGFIFIAPCSYLFLIPSIVLLGVNHMLVNIEWTSKKQRNAHRCFCYPRLKFSNRILQSCTNDNCDAFYS